MEEDPAQARTAIPAFLCNWCCYAAADAAGVSRYQYPASIRPIRLMCTGRAAPAFLLEPFRQGAWGVFLGGCHPGDCHYQRGNYEALLVAALTRRILKEVGLEPERLQVVWASAAEAVSFAQGVTEFTRKLKRLGPPGSGGG